MPWQEESSMDLRRQFIQDVQRGVAPITEESYHPVLHAGLFRVPRREAETLSAHPQGPSLRSG